MTRIVLNDEQGNLLGYIARPVADERIADAKRRRESDGPWHTTEEVLHQLNSLEPQSWCEQFEAWALSHRPLAQEADDSREAL